MELDKKLTVQEILGSSHFRDAKIIAGNKGLDRTVRWVHIMEVKNIGTLLNGNELILSTGVGWGEEEAISVLEQLIERDASGLCIELGTAFTKLPDKMVKLADEHSFPLIIFTKEVRFIDITYELNTYYINNKFRIYSELEKFSQQLNQFLLSPHHIMDILKFLNNYLNVFVVYIPLEGEIQFVPSLSTSEQKKAVELIYQIKSDNLRELEHENKIIRNNIAYQAITVFNQKWAEIAIIKKEGIVSEFELSVLDKCSSSIGQKIFYRLETEEKKKQNEAAWILDWLDGKLTEEDIYQHLINNLPNNKVSQGVTCLININPTIPNNAAVEETKIQFNIVARALIEREGFGLLIASKDNNLIYILLNMRGKLNWKKRVTRVIEQLKKVKTSKNLNIYMGIGTLTNHLPSIYKSFKAAQQAVSIQQIIKNNNQVFYEDFHVYRIISLLDKHHYLGEFVHDYLEPLIEYDKQHQGELLETLRILLECNGSKQKAAKKLFVARQTLYHRVKKLENLLGDDFMTPEKRITIELALYARNYQRKGRDK